MLMRSKVTYHESEFYHLIKRNIGFISKDIIDLALGNFLNDKPSLTFGW